MHTHTPINPFAHTHSSFITIVHPDDRKKVVSVLSVVILTMVSPPAPIQCRLRHGETSAYQPFDLRVQYGTQGLVCTLWAAEK